MYVVGLFDIHMYKRTIFIFMTEMQWEFLKKLNVINMYVAWTIPTILGIIQLEILIGAREFF